MVVGTPDHWHALAALEALRNGKDVYCEKPITHLFAEGQAVYREVAKHKAIFQTGSQQRSDTRFRIAAEVVLNGLHRQGQARRGRPADRQGHRRGGQGSPANPRRPRLRHVVRPEPHAALPQGPPPLELALVPRLRRRPAHGLDRPPQRHRPLGARHGQERPDQGRGEGLPLPDEGDVRQPDRLRGRSRPTPAATRSRSPTRTPHGRRSGSARTAGSTSTAARSRRRTRTGSASPTTAARSRPTSRATTGRTSSRASGPARSASARPRPPTARSRPATSATSPTPSAAP